MNEPLYPTDRVDWCMYTLFTNNLEKMQKNCIIKPKVHLTNLAHSLDGNLWAISSIGAEKLQIHCVHQNRVVTIPPPLHIIDIGNSCEAFSTNIYIPAKSELTATFQSVTCSQFFLKYNLKYENLTLFVVFSAIKQYELTEKDKTELHSKVSMLEPMPMELFEQELTCINEDYPYTLPVLVMSSMLMGSMCSTLVILGVIIAFCLKHRKRIAMIWKFSTIIVGKLGDNPNLLPHLMTMAQRFLSNVDCPPPPPPARMETPPEPSTSSDEPRVHRTASHHTLQYLQQAAHELYAQGQLKAKPLASYLHHKKQKEQVDTEISQSEV